MVHWTNLFASTTPHNAMNIGELKSFPRVRLGHAPTPIDAAPNLGEFPAGVEVHVKRDDCSGLAFGSNKVRQPGMDIHIQLEDRAPGKDATWKASGNVLLDRLLGATVHYFPEGENEAVADANLHRIAVLGLMGQELARVAAELGISTFADLRFFTHA